jgi:superfamily I DNA/RNA helicase
VTNFRTNYAKTSFQQCLQNISITVTGDDDQSIYRFQRAAVSNIVTSEKFSQSKVVGYEISALQEILDKTQ